MFTSVLVANRGEIAVRIIRTLRTMGLRSIAVFSDADADSLPVRMADDAVWIGPAAAVESYLSIESIINAARLSGAEAIHPGYGFLAENADFARACSEAGLVFIGPSAHAIEVMGDKIHAKEMVAKAGVPVVPGVTDDDIQREGLAEALSTVDFPLLIKPTAGGGGKGMQVVRKGDDIAAALHSARRTAQAAFGNDTLLLEQLIEKPRHIEVQILADQHGNIVHLGERECSLQRRHQKIIEEAPSVLLNESSREQIGSAAIEAARSINYLGAGTVEFIVSADEPDVFFFMEMNTRLQVEHPVTESVTGLDLVEWQLRIALGEPLTITQSEVRMHGHAIEARIYAEDPTHHFVPTGGTVLFLHEPVGEHVRVDSWLTANATVTSYYDPMLAKIICWGDSRSAALRNLRQALAETSILGVITNTAFLQNLLANKRVHSGDIDTNLVEDVQFDTSLENIDIYLIAAAMDRWLSLWPTTTAASPWDIPSGWRIGESEGAAFHLTTMERTATIRLYGSPANAQVVFDDSERTSARIRLTSENEVELFYLNKISRFYRARADDGALWLSHNGIAHVVSAATSALVHNEERSASGPLFSPMPGNVLALSHNVGDSVPAGATIMVIEAMKMEHPITAPVAGVIAEMYVRQGQRVSLGESLVVVKPDEVTT